MISTLALLGICLMPAQELRQEPVQHELQLHQIEDLIDLQAEIQARRMDLLVLEGVSALLSAQASDADLAGSIGLDLVGWALTEGINAEKENEFSVPEASLESVLGQLHGGVYPFNSAKELVEAVQAYMVPKFDPRKQSLKVDVSGESRVLLAYLQPAQQQWLTQYLDLQREADQWTALLKVKLYSVPAGKFNLDEGLAATFNSEDELLAMEQSCIGVGGKLIFSPSLVALPGQSSQVSVLSELSYVSSWEMVTVQPSGKSIADPTVGVFEEGQILKTRVLQIADAQYGIEINLETIRVKQPFKSSTMELNGEEFEIGVPQKISHSIESSLNLPSGGGAILISRNYEEDQDLVVTYYFERVPVKE